MASQFSFIERPESREETYDPPTYRTIWKCVGTMDEALVQLYALSATPYLVARPTAVLYRKDVRISPDGWNQHVVEVEYGKKDKQSTPVGEFTFDFDTTGATVRIKAAKEHVATYDSGGTVAGDQHKGAIGVKPDGEVEGADIIIPALRLNYNFKHPLGMVDESFARTLAAATGHTNLYEFRGFQPGELLFAGSVGSDGSQAEAAVGYQFIASGNESSLTIGEIAGIVKQGHHIAWIEFEDDVESDRPVRRPERVHIDRVYDPIDFASTFGWS